MRLIDRLKIGDGICASMYDNGLILILQEARILPLDLEQINRLYIFSNANLPFPNRERTPVLQLDEGTTAILSRDVLFIAHEGHWITLGTEKLANLLVFARQYQYLIVKSEAAK